MPFRITGRHVEITDTIRDYVEKKLPRIEKYTVRLQSIDFILEKNRYQHRAELLIKDGPVEVTANAKDPDLIKAIDLLMDKVERQLKKRWERLREGKKESQRKREAAELAESLVPTEGEPGGGGATAVKTARRARRAPAQAEEPEMPELVEKLGIMIFSSPILSVQEMSVESAAEELYFKDENFVCFLNEANEKPSIIYRRKDGHFNLLELEIAS